MTGKKVDNLMNESAELAELRPVLPHTFKKSADLPSFRPVASLQNQSDNTQSSSQETPSEPTGSDQTSSQNQSDEK